MKRREILKGLTVLPIAGAAIASAAPTTVQAQDKDPWTPKKQSVGGLRSGHLLFLGGIGGYYPEKGQKPGDVKSQTKSALDSMKATLEKAGTSLDNVLKVQVSLVDPEKNWEGMNEVYDTYFTKSPKPVRSYFGATGYRKGHEEQLLQIDCIAYID
jgi:2-iminobutanoate/2-iminopropanoate deaminase